MDSFETLICELFSAEGWWTIQGFKVELTPEEKRRIGKPSSPRWEIDALAYNQGKKELRIIECKSYLDSKGVNADDILNPKEDEKSRYKLFVDATLRETILSALQRQCVKAGLIDESVKLRLCLAVGKMKSKKCEEELKAHFDQMEWVLFTPSDIAARLKKLAKSGYTDSVTPLVVKLLEILPDQEEE